MILSKLHVKRVIEMEKGFVIEWLHPKPFKVPEDVAEWLKDSYDPRLVGVVHEQLYRMAEVSNMMQAME